LPLQSDKSLAKAVFIETQRIGTADQRRAAAALEQLGRKR
jgi:hypothetical protein